MDNPDSTQPAATQTQCHIIGVTTSWLKSLGSSRVRDKHTPEVKRPTKAPKNAEDRTASQALWNDLKDGFLPLINS